MRISGTAWIQRGAPVPGGPKGTKFRGGLWLALAIVAHLGVFGCGVLVGNPDDEDEETQQGKDDPPAGETAVSFSITDAPVDEAEAVHITVDRLEVSGGSGWTEIPLSESGAIDLLSLTGGASKVLGELEGLEPGTYEQVRLRLSEDTLPTISFPDGSEDSLRIPSSAQTGVKIVTPFEVKEGVTNGFTIDFDLRKSVVKTANGYQMKPTLRLVRTENTGKISGLEADDYAVVCAYKKGQSKDETSDCDNAVNSAMPESGQFVIPFLPEGNYELRFFENESTYTDLEKPAKVEADKTTDVTAP